MHLLAAASQPDYIAIGMVAVLFLCLIVMVFRKRSALKKRAAQIESMKKLAQQGAKLEEPAAAVPTAPGSAGQIKLYNVEPKTAAMIMAIVADKMGKPINELRFISIKEVK